MRRLRCFANIPRIKNKLQTLHDVDAATFTLASQQLRSGGEAQR